MTYDTDCFLAALIPEYYEGQPHYDALQRLLPEWHGGTCCSGTSLILADDILFIVDIRELNNLILSSIITNVQLRIYLSNK